MNRSPDDNGFLLALLFSLVVLAFAIMWSGSRLTPGDAWYALIVVNNSNEAVVVLVDGTSPRLEDVVIEQSSRKRIESIWFRPGHVVNVEVRDIHGEAILTVDASPLVREGTSADWYLEVVVPGIAADECR